MSSTPSLIESLDEASSQIQGQTEAIQALSAKEDKSALEVALKPFFTLIENAAGRGGDTADLGLVADRTCELANSLRISTSMGIAGEILLTGTLEIDDRKPFLDKLTRQNLENELLRYRRFDLGAKTDIAIGQGQYSLARAHIETLREGASEAENQMFDEVLKKIGQKELSEKRIALYAAGGVLAILLMISIINIFTGSSSLKPAVAAHQGIVLDRLAKPLAGLDNPLFSIDEVRYCKAFYAVFYAASTRIDQNDQEIVQRYKSGVDDYARRCTKYRYKQEDMAEVDREIAKFNATAEADKLVGSWRRAASLARIPSKPVPPISDLIGKLPQ